ncbi:MAG: helix-turn-helix domain-containing protein [Solirubrobacteraceae bacterium]
MSSEQQQQHSSGDPVGELREVSDARTLRALTHPVRVELLETLQLQGPMTATEAGERIGESPTTCSFHLRQLAKYGFVEEAGGGRGRARPWRMTTFGMRFSSVHDDAETELAAGALSRLFHNREMDRMRGWLETQGSYPREWREAAHSSKHLMWVTPDELKALEQQLTEMLVPLYRDRLTDPSARPPGSLPVELLIFGHPIAPPSGQEPKR